MKYQPYYCYLLVILILISCNSASEMPDISNKEDALTAYEEYRNRLQSSDKSSTDNLRDNLKIWKVLEDTVLHFLIADSTLDQTHIIQDMTRCAITRNEITNEIIRLTDTQLHTYADIIDIQQSFNGYNLKDKYPDIFHDAEDFFNGLTAKAYAEKSAPEIITEYADKLLYWKSKGFSSKQDMLAFIREEDCLFSSFLDHLYEYDDKSVKTIITLTNYISGIMLQAANTGKLEMKELRIYLGMRTNRRLIQNAIKCADAIRMKHVKTPEQASMTISILLNPYSNYNRLCNGTRTQKQTKELYSLAAQISPMINQLKESGLIEKPLPDSLPNKFIKEHILITMK